MKRSKQNDPLWNNGQTTTSASEQMPQPEHNDPVIEAQQKNSKSKKHSH